MAGFDQYQAIPGHNARFKDGNLNLRRDPNPPSTESVVLLGTATDGPIMQPVPATPDNIATFGKVAYDNGVPNGSTLVAKFEELWAAGNRDIRLMRVTGTKSVSSLLGASYSKSTQEIAQDGLGGTLARGNAPTLFTLPHGGITPSSFELKANGAIVPPSNYTLTAGTQENEETSTAPVLATVQLHENAADAKAEITVSYSYAYVDGTGATQNVDVTDNNTDASGTPMVADGIDQVIDLQHVALAGLKLYANGVEITDSTVFSVTGDKLTIHPSTKIRIGDVLEASYAYNVVSVIQPKIELESVFGGTIYNELKRKVEEVNGNVVVTITKPETKRAISTEAPLVFHSSEYPTYGLLVQAINAHLNNNVVVAKTMFPDEFTNTLVSTTEQSFSGGKDELNLSKEEMYKRLGGEKDADGYVVKPGAYQYLENYNVDYVVPLGVFADDKLIGKYDNFAYQLALACAVMSHYNNVTIGLITTSSPTDLSLPGIEAHVKKIEALSNEYYMRDRFGALIKDGEGNNIDLGQFIEVIAGPDFIVRSTRLGQIASNSPASYVGMVSQLPVQSAPTNKAIPSVIGLRWEYSTAQVNRLTQKRFVTFRYKPNGQVGVVDAMTAAHAGSDYTRLSTARIVKQAVNAVREVADPFIGEPNDQANRNALTSAIDKRLGKMVELKALLGFDVILVVTPQMELIGEGSIELSLQAPNELRRLTTVVGLQA